jgi:hypothetical protein
MSRDSTQNQSKSKSRSSESAVAGHPAPPAPLPQGERGTKPKPNRKSENSTPDQHARRARPNNNSVDPRPNFESPTPVGPNLLDGDDVERDDIAETTPYAVPGTGIKKCPDCRGELPLDATFCVHCGTELGDGKKKKKREFTPLHREWEPYLPFALRMKVFVGMQILNVMIFFAMLATLGAATSFTGIVMQTAMQAFLLGSFDRLIVTRTAKGKAEIQRLWRVGFYPIAPQKIDWRVSHGTAIVPLHTVGFFEWLMMIYLLLCGILPGLLFYWFVIKPERFDVVLCDVHGSTDSAIFRTSSRDIADEICTVVSEVTTLDYRKVV